MIPQQARAALEFGPQNLALVPSTDMTITHNIYNSVSEHLMPTSGLSMDIRHMQVFHIHTCSQALIDDVHICVLYE